MLQRGSAPRADSVEIPGTPLILKQGAHVAITVINRLPEPTTVHWHGMELESYFDGVSGWSGSPSPEAMLFCSMELRQRWRLNSGPTRT
ncbi:MAG TPA: multicopper oxidase domain-containing protein [Gemmatimonadaceae bacterium]